jgi:hypothetical protein
MPVYEMRRLITSVSYLDEFVKAGSDFECGLCAPSRFNSASFDRLEFLELSFGIVEGIKDTVEGYDRRLIPRKRI